MTVKSYTDVDALKLSLRKLLDAEQAHIALNTNESTKRLMAGNDKVSTVALIVCDVELGSAQIDGWQVHKKLQELYVDARRK